MIEQRLDIGTIVAELDIPDIGVSQPVVRDSLIRLGEIYQATLNLSALTKTPVGDQYLRAVMLATVQEATKVVNYWTKILDRVGLGEVANQIQVLVASDFIYHELGTDNHLS